MSNKHSKLAPKVQQTLQEVRSLLRKYVWTQTAFSIACLILFLFWLGGCIDFLPVTMGADESPRWLRIAILAGMGLGALWTVVFWALPRLTAQIRDRSIALLLERKHPELENHLITAVELAEPSTYAGEFDEVSNPAAYDTMLTQVHSNLDAQVGKVEPKSLFDWQPVWAARISTGLALAITLAACFMMPNWMGRWSKRLFLLSDEPWPRQALLRADGVQVQLPPFTGQLAAERSVIPFEDGSAKLVRGSSVQLQISAEAETKVVPEVCTLFYQQQDGTRGRANMRRLGAVENGWQAFVLDGPPLDGVAQDTSFRVVGLDASLKGYVLQLVEPPIVKNAKLELVYPDYLLSSLTRAAKEVVEFRSGMRIPEGTQVTFIGEANSMLSRVEYVVQASGEDSEEQIDGESDNKGIEIQQAKCEDTAFRIELGRMRKSGTLEIRLVDEYGLAADKVANYLLTLQPDEIPLVESNLRGIGKEITEKALLPVRGDVRDDHGLQQLSVDLQSSDESSWEVEVAIPEETELSADVDLKQLAEEQGFSLEPGDTLGLQVSASDYFDLDSTPHLGQGQSKQLNVVTDDELLVILDRKELELRQRLEQIILELEQLKGSLKQLDLSGPAANAEIQAAGTVAATPRLKPQEDEEDSEAEEEARRKRMFLLRSQQAVLQGDKSQQELAGIASNVEDLRQQLANNRIDSYDRQKRLSEKVRAPLLALLENEYKQFATDLQELQSFAMEGSISSKAQEAEESAAIVLAKLAQIQENMLDIESFNEIIDLVRSLLEDQERLLNDTEKEQRQRILDLLK
ncbi:MAG: hypothetical protein AAF483_18805 [Planctomycetota bacterium]